jgi:uncharacterized protein YbjT (DUF2867 family)
MQPSAPTVPPAGLRAAPRAGAPDSGPAVGVRVLVTGGTGFLGRQLVPRLRTAGYTVRLMSRRHPRAGEDAGVEWARADLRTGAGVAAAVRGVQHVVHAATSSQQSSIRPHLEATMTRQILQAAGEAGVRHLVYVSIVGIERIPFGYYRQKLEAEALVQQGAVPWTILRATQFHDLLDLFLRLMLWPPVALLPADLTFQPIDPSAVAERLVGCVEAGPRGRVEDIGGPEVRTAGELARSWLEARRVRRVIVPLWLPGRVAAGFRRGFNTCPEHRAGGQTWEAWLRRRYDS